VIRCSTNIGHFLRPEEVVRTGAGRDVRWNDASSQPGMATSTAATSVAPPTTMTAASAAMTATATFRVARQGTDEARPHSLRTQRTSGPHAACERRCLDLRSRPSGSCPAEGHSEQLGCLQLVRVARNGNAASPLPGAALSWRAISEARFIPL
jgi:hypothetical protein